MFERVRNSARGRAGGGDGALGRVYVPNLGELRAKGREVVPPGHHIVLETPGGGGLGNPLRRSRDSVREDVLDGYISEAAAAKNHGYQSGDELD